MFRPQAQAETHRDPAGPPRASRRPCAEAHSNRRGLPLAFASGTYFFLFIYRLQAQAHSGPESLPRGSRLNLFFFYLFIDYKHRRDRSAKRGPGAFFIDSPYNIGYLKIRK